MKITRVGLVTALFLLLSSMLLVAHFLPPLGLFGYLVGTNFATWLIFRSVQSPNVFISALLTYMFIGSHDIGFRYLAGGIHDAQGNGVIILLFFVSLVPASAILIWGTFSQNKKGSIGLKLLSVTVFGVLIFLHVKLFGGAGMVRPVINL